MGSTILKALMAVVSKLFMSLASEKLIEWSLFYLIGLAVKSTKTKVDDEFYVKVKEAYEVKK